MKTKTPFVRDMFQNRIEKYKDKTALEFNRQTITYGDLWNQSARLKNSILTSDLLSKQRRIGLLMDNSIEYVICEMAIIMVGATRVGINTLLSESEIEYILRDAEIEILFIDKDFLDIILSIEPKLTELKQIIIVDGKDYCHNKIVSLDRFLQKNKKEFVQMPLIKSNDVAMVAYTGGTTGESKGVVITQEILFMILTSHIIETELNNKDNLLLMTPFSHSAGMILLTGLLVGARITINKFEGKTFVHEIEQGITFTFMVPTMIYRVLDYLQEQSHEQLFDLSSLKTILYGAAPITRERLKEGIEIFGNVFVQLYGQTESYNFITKLTKEDHVSEDDTLLNSCGQPVLMSQVKIVDDRGEELNQGEVGEIIVKSPYNMAYYLNKEKETKRALKDGWLYTGDLGYLNKDGYLFLLDRKNDMIISGGFNVYSSEVENVLQNHSKVSQVSVLGLPDPDWGERIVAVIIPKSNESITEKELKIFISDKISKYKQPKEYFFLTNLPVTPFGKVNKKLLRQQIKKDGFNE